MSTSHRPLSSVARVVASTHARALDTHVVALAVSGDTDCVLPELGNLVDYDSDLVVNLLADGFACICRTAFEDAETFACDLKINRQRHPTSKLDVALAIFDPAGEVVYDWACPRPAISQLAA